MRRFVLAAAVLAILSACGGDGGDSDRVTVLGPNNEKVEVINPCSVVTEAEVISIFGSTGPAVQTSANCHWGDNGPETTLRVFVRTTLFGDDVDERRDYFSDNQSVVVEDLPNLGDDAIVVVGTRRYEPGGPLVTEVDDVVFQVGTERVILATGVEYHFAPGSSEAEQLISVARAAASRMKSSKTP